MFYVGRAVLMSKKIKVCLVGSSGGHLTHLYMLKPFWRDKERFWVTFDKEDARSLLKGEKMYPCYYPSNRSIKALIINTVKALKIIPKSRPKRGQAVQTTERAGLNRCRRIFRL